MECKDRNGNVVSCNDGQDKVLKSLYETKAGRAALKVLTQPVISKAGSYVLDSKLSKAIIPGFIQKNGISMEEYADESYESYNQFFTRKIKEGKRDFAKEPELFCAPCDGKLSVYSITGDATFCIKDTEYTMESLLRNKKLAGRYEDGILMVFRLTVDDYHHFAYVDDGVRTKNYRIPGVLHTVNPLANDVYPIYKENAREFSILKSKNFGRILMMEVGAMMVGKIVNYHEEQKVRRGMEKGYFEFGGSTVILALEPQKVQIASDIVQNTQDGFETIVKMGEVIGRKKGNE